MRPFNACSLCLERARTPLACNEGHLFCTECVFTDLGALFVLVVLPPAFVTSAARTLTLLQYADALKSCRVATSRNRRPS